MNKALLLILILLLLRMMNAHSQMTTASISVEATALPVRQQLQTYCTETHTEKKDIAVIKSKIAYWSKNSRITNSTTPVVNPSCADIDQQQDLIYSQLKIVKPQYTVKKQIVIAIIDTGIDYTNPILNARIYRPKGWNLPNEFKGFDLIQQNFFPMDKDGHGTHVAGIIAGVFPEAKILPIKFYEKSQMRSDLGSAIRLAVYMGANIINISAGGYGEDSSEQEAINLAKEKGILVVSAAGNDSKNLDNHGDEFFPASYGTDNIISVMANESDGYIASYSNFGVNHADISALGTIQSYLPTTISSSCHGSMSGTSQATPIIAATAAILWSSKPHLTYNQVKNQLLKGVDTSILLMAANKSQGMVNIDRAISGQLQK